MKSWSTALKGRIPAELFREIEIFAHEIELKRQGKIDDAVFGETRLRRGAYGQRYDNGLRHDGIVHRTLPFPTAASKGVGTRWDAPGMQRIKIPYGGLSAEQLDRLAEVAEEYSDGILHITTRQDVQLHYVHLEDTPDLMLRLAEAGITTREACGNTIRNVTACPYSGVCNSESFDVTPYAHACATFLLGHPDAQDFGRKFKIAFSGCVEESCGLASMHDLGFVAQTRVENGSLLRGFSLFVGGGLGAVPHQAKLFDPFLPVSEILPICQAVCRVFARLGEKKNRARARMKFLVAKLGIDEFRRLVLEERQALKEDPRWAALVEDTPNAAAPQSRDSGSTRQDLPLAFAPPTSSNLVQIGHKPASTSGQAAAATPLKTASPFEGWQRSNVRAQRQSGYVVVTVSLPLGDLSSDQARALGEISRRFSTDTMRTTVEQNIVLRWVKEDALLELFEALKRADLAESGAGTIVDITACPGTDTCKLGQASSRGLAGELRTRIAENTLSFDQAVNDFRIKISGCFNSCAQHHVSDVGFYGVMRKIDGHAVPHFQVVLGGQWRNNAGAYGLALGAVPSKRVPEVLLAITALYVAERKGLEPFFDFVARIGKARLKEVLEAHRHVPPVAQDPSFYSDWRDPRRYSMGDLGKGECAGEVVSPTEFGLAASEREVFEAQLALERKALTSAAELAYQAMLTAARALLQIKSSDVAKEPEGIIAAFRRDFFDTELFFDPFARGKFAAFLFRAHNDGHLGLAADQVHQRVEEAQLFIEAAHACQLRMSGGS